MLTNSRDIRRRLEGDGWHLVRIAGSHHIFRHPTTGAILASASEEGSRTRPCPEDLQRGRLAEGLIDVIHYVAIVEEEPGKAIGLWFPDLPGCFSAGDSLEEAMLNAREALAAYADALRDESRPLPASRSITDLKGDPEIAHDLATHMVALVPLEHDVLRPAAE